MIVLSDLLSATIAYLKYHKPTTKVYDSIQTFAVVEELTDMNSEQLNKDASYIDTLYYFSRINYLDNFNKSNLGYSEPVLIIYEKSATIGKLFEEGAEFKPVYEVGVFMKWVKDTNDIYQLNRSDIYEKTKDLLYNYVYYLSQCKYYRDNKVMHPSIHEALNYTDPIDDNLTRAWTRVFKEMKEVDIIRAEGYNRDLYGTVITMPLVFSQCSVEYDFTVEVPDRYNAGDQGNTLNG